MERITVAPGDPRNNAPEWLCITNQRINPYQHREYCASYEEGLEHRKRTKEESAIAKVRKRVMLETGFITPGMCETLTGFKRRSISSMIARGDIQALLIDGVHWLSPVAVDAIKERKARYADMRGEAMPEQEGCA